MGQVQIGGAIAASFRFIGEAWARAWGVMLLLVWVTAILEVIELLKPDWFLVPFLGLFVLLFANTAAAGALYRLRLEGDHPGDQDYAAHAAGLQWSGLEWRVMGANLLVGLIVGFLAFVALFIWAIALGVMLQGSPGDLQDLQSGDQSDKMVALGHLMLGPGGVVSAIILIPSVVGLFYLSARLMLFTPLVTDTRVFDFGRAWVIARGAMVVLLVTLMVIFVADFVVGVAGGIFIGAFALAVHGDEANQWGGAAGQVLSAAINPPLLAGLGLYVYRIQRGDTAIATTFA
jgi:hypothetical protein